MLLISPLTWFHAQILLFLPITILVRETINDNSKVSDPIMNGRVDLKRGLLNREKKLLLILFALQLISLPDVELARQLMSAFAPYGPPWYAGLLLAGNTIGVIILAGLLIQLAFRTIRSE